MSEDVHRCPVCGYAEELDAGTTTLPPLDSTDQIRREVLADCERMIMDALAEARRIVDTAEANADEFRRTHRQRYKRAYDFLEQRGR